MKNYKELDKINKNKFDINFSLFSTLSESGGTSSPGLRGGGGGRPKGTPNRSEIAHSAIYTRVKMYDFGAPRSGGVFSLLPPQCRLPVVQQPG